MSNEEHLIENCMYAMKESSDPYEALEQELNSQRGKDLLATINLTFDQAYNICFYVYDNFVRSY